MARITRDPRRVSGAGDRRGLRRAVHDDGNARVDPEHAELVWTHPGMRNGYRIDRGRVFSPMRGRRVDCRRTTRQPDLADDVATPLA